MPLPTYRWSWAEIGWAAFVAALTALLMDLVDFNAAQVTDWQTWAMALLSGAIRAAVGGALAVITRFREQG